MKKPNGDAATLRFAQPVDVPELAELERTVWGDGGADAAQLAARIQNVPKGNIVAVLPDGRFCGLTSFCLINYGEYESQGRCSWDDLSGCGTASTHDPKGRDLYGINLGVARWAPKDTSIRLLSEVVRAGFRHRVHRGLLGARMPGYHKWADKMTAEEYWKAERRPGVLLDPELRYYNDFGMRATQLVPNYFDDPESLNYGVIVEMPLPWALRPISPVIAALPIDLVAVLERIG